MLHGSRGGRTHRLIGISEKVIKSGKVLGAVELNLDTPGRACFCCDDANLGSEATTELCLCGSEVRIELLRLRHYGWPGLAIETSNSVFSLSYGPIVLVYSL